MACASGDAGAQPPLGWTPSPRILVRSWTASDHRKPHGGQEKPQAEGSPGALWVPLFSPGPGLAQALPRNPSEGPLPASQHKCRLVASPSACSSGGPHLWLSTLGALSPPCLSWPWGPLWVPSSWVSQAHSCPGCGKMAGHSLLPSSGPGAQPSLPGKPPMPPGQFWVWPPQLPSTPH